MRPAHKISVEDIKRGLCSHYEGQSFEVKKRHPVKNPKIIAPICRNTTIEALVCEMMPKLADIKFHMTVGRPCEVPYSTYQPFAGILPPGTVFNEAAEERLKKYNLPL
jgi:dipeptidase